MNQLALKITSYSEATAEIEKIRQSVFQVEQGVDPALDFDGLDQSAKHIVIYCNQEPVGTARIRYLSSHLAKIERVAVLAAHRGQGLGKAIMQAAIEFLDQNNVPESKVHAQSHAASFYQKLGFNPNGQEFYEAEILHIEMRRTHPNLKNESCEQWLIK
jgi:predicted GNAT family N-acyltransferase